jgi:hypothetical protein
VDLIEVDPVGAQATQTVLDGADNVHPRQSLVIGTGPTRMRHLVASTKRSRLPASHLPTNSSVRPTSRARAALGDVGSVDERDAALRARSMMAKEVRSSHWWPKVMVPRHTSETLSPVRPIRRVFIGWVPWGLFRAGVTVSAGGSACTEQPGVNSI